MSVKSQDPEARPAGSEPEYDVFDSARNTGLDNGRESESSSVDQIKRGQGVRKVEVISRQYGGKGKIAVFISIFLVSYAYGLDNSMRTIFLATATNSFGQHSLLSTVSVVQAVVAAAAQPIFARFSDVFGRLEILLAALFLYVIGTIIQCTSKNVQHYAGGTVIYQFGYTGLMLVLQLIVADFSFLNWRLLGSLVPAAPFIINTWISGNITADIGSKWQWGVGMWGIIVPASAIPLIVCFVHMIHKASAKGELEQFKYEKTGIRALGPRKYFVALFWKLDVVGVTLLAAVLALLLVPLTIAGGIQAQWKTAKVIAPLVIGFLLIPAFIFWEKYTKFPVAPFHLLKDRGVWAAMVIGVLIDFIWYMQGDYMYTVLQVAMNQTVLSATRITSLYSFVSTLTGLGLGFVVAKFKHVKGFIIFGTAMWLLSMGLLIKYRGGESSYSGVIGSLCLLGFGAGFFTYPTQASIQSCTRHEHMAVITALYLASYNVGSAFGTCLSGAMWTQVMPKEIAKRISDPAIVKSAYSTPFAFIVSYPWGTPERTAVVDAYKHVQKLMVIVGTCLCIPLIGAAVCLRDHKLGNVQSLELGDSEDKEAVRY